MNKIFIFDVDGYENIKKYSIIYNGETNWLKQ